MFLLIRVKMTIYNNYFVHRKKKGGTENNFILALNTMT